MNTQDATLTRGRYIWRSLVYYRRTHFAVALGVAAATAVLTGALLIGDSVRGSLRQLTLERLGLIDEVLVSDHFFRAELADEVAREAPFRKYFAGAEPAILLPSTTVELATAGNVQLASQVLTVGCDATFFQLSGEADERQLTVGRDEIILNQPLAEDLHASVGDLVTVRFADASQVPADSTLAQKSDRLRSLLRRKVAFILPPRGFGRFSLQPNQNLPKTAFVHLESLQDVLGVGAHVNAILVKGNSRDADPQTLTEAHQAIAATIHPRIEDVGLRVERIRRRFPTDGENAETIYDYCHVTSDRMILDPPLLETIEPILRRLGGQPVSTYLADSIRLAGNSASSAVEVPYSIITGIDSSPDFPLLPPGETLGPDDIVFNHWTAERLSAKPGDRITVTFFEPESPHGKPRLQSHTFTLRAVVPLTEPASPYRRNRPAVYDRRPEIFNDPHLTPVVEGITDQESIESWNPPFPFDIKRIKPADDDYWKNHRTTPKAFVSIATARRLWGSRFGYVTSWRIPTRDDTTVDRVRASIEGALRDSPRLARMGFAFSPVKRDGLAASSGTTPFDFLFLGLSMFLIAAAILLVALLYQLGVERRVRQLGLMAAIGMPRRSATRLLVWEGTLVAALGGGLGIAVGIAYCQLMLAGLRSESWWRGAVGTPFLELFITPRSLVVGYLSGVAVCALAIMLASRRLNRIPPRRLLAGQSSTETTRIAKPARWPMWAGVLLIGGAIATVAGASGLSGEAQAGAFMGSGFLILLVLVLWQWRRLRESRVHARFRLSTLAAGNAARNPTRSLLTIGLMATATFLIVSMSCFRVAPSLVGSGGFRLEGRSSLPLFVDLNDPDTRTRWFGQDAAVLKDVTILSLRSRRGDDASCRNLYQVRRPGLLGVPRAMAEYFDRKDRVAFPWAAAAKTDGHRSENPWHLLSMPRDDHVIPVILDNNTALYSLHWSGGIGSRYSVTYDDGQTLEFEIVGLLGNSLLQGSLLIDEERLVQAFPEVAGYQYFLIDAPASKLDDVQRILENRLSDEGLDVRRTDQVLADLLAVQNTYLSTFQSLGALGLLLGTFGLATVQARSVLERRGELALFQAQGFRRRRIARLVLIENIALLLHGLMTGVVAALCAVLPQILLGGARVPVWGVLELLALVLVIGIVTARVTIHWALQGSLIQNLRGE